MELKNRIEVALGLRPADLLLKNARVISVLSGKIWKTNIAISEKYIAGFGDYKTKKVIDLKGQYVSAGFVDSHMHLESSLLTPVEFAKMVVPHGTTSIVIDPHEIANVMGLEGIHYMIRAAKDLPLDIYMMLPSCVPATNLDTSGAYLNADDLELLSSHKKVLGLGEVMDFPGVLARRRDLLDKLRIKSLIRIDGHAPGLTGKDLYAYAVGNIRSDHECTTKEEAFEKLNAGLHIMIREGSSAKNLEALLPIITPVSARRCLFCTDDTEPDDLAKRGHIDHIVRKAIRLGLDPVLALMIATANAADYFRLPVKQGAVSIGYRADLVIFDDLKNIRINKVIKNGKVVAEDGEMLHDIKPNAKFDLRGSVNVGRVSKDALKIKARGRRARVIEIIPHQIVTKSAVMDVAVSNGEAHADTSKDILKVAVVERHMGTGNIGLGFIKGLGLKKGAIATSIAHDSHNIIVAGTNDRDMMLAVLRIIENQGGMVVVSGGVFEAEMPLPIAGLMSNLPAGKVVEKMHELKLAAKKLGCKIENPFQTLSFMSLTVIPELKLTDKGLVEVSKQKYVPLFV